MLGRFSAPVLLLQRDHAYQQTLDMRKHLMYRYCANLGYAPPEMLNLGTPCMDAITCDKLIRITSQTEPGRATFTRGMVIKQS